MFSNSNPYLIDPKDCIPTEVEFINAVQTYNTFKKGIIYESLDDVAQYILGVSKNVETLIKYYLAFYFLSYETEDPLMADIRSKLGKQIVKIFKSDKFKSFIKEEVGKILEKDEDEFMDMVYKYVDFLD